jgi:crotonobetainyl-CoA:carnitine CoA-transferase CaiB-like acyl-CoA transferase
MSFAPLAGTRVLDLTQSVAGPYCTLILGALGADIVKVERPSGGDDTRAWGPPFLDEESLTYLSLNSSKRSLAVDLTSEQGRDLVLDVAEGCDVVVQSLRPGLADRLGLGFHALSARRRDVIYCSLGAYGSHGPLADQPGYDPLMQAAAGIMSLTGHPGQDPVRAGVSVVDQGTGMWAALGILAALRARDGGRAEAQHVELSLFEVALNWVPYQLAGVLATGKVPKPQGSGLGIIAPYEAFEASGGWVMIAAANDRLFAALCEALELPGLPHDERFRTNPDRVGNREPLRALIAERVAPMDVAECLRLLAAAGVPAAPVHDLGQVAAFPQTEALGIIQRLAHPARASIDTVAPPVSVDGDRWRHRFAAPGLGEHSHEILLDAGVAPERIEQLHADGVIRDGRRSAR